MNVLKIILVLGLLAIPLECINDCKRFKRRSPQHQCELSPQTYEGPFYVTKNFIRSNITEYRPGISFKLIMTFTDPKTCSPIPGLWIDIWQCDAIGYYSQYTKFNPIEPFNLDVDHAPPTDGSTFLRGRQKTNKRGQVQFDTLMPGWYANRTRHIHFKIYHKLKAIFSGQLYFTEGLSSWLHNVFPYYVHEHIPNSKDIAFMERSGEQTTIYNVKPVNSKRPIDGFVGEIVIGLNLNSIDFRHGNDLNVQSNMIY